MSASVQWYGLDLYRRALLGWPVEVAIEAKAILEREAQAAYDEMRSPAPVGYPVKSGDLREGLTLTDTSPSELHPRFTLYNPVFYAKIFEAGGATTAGPKSPGRVFVPISIRHRRAARDAIVQTVLRGPRGTT